MVKYKYVICYHVGGGKLKKILPILLILIGVFFIISPFLFEQLIKYNSRRVPIEDITIEEIEKNNKTEAEFDLSSVSDVTIASVLDNAADTNNKPVIGILEIPELKIKLPILKGLTNANLLAGAATMKPDQSMGNGNYTLAGHMMKNRNILFGHLMDIKIGTIVTISDKKDVYKYKIYDTIVVHDTAVEMLLDEKAEKRGNPIISLMTCYYSSKTGKRFFALGDLIDKYPIEKDTTR